MDTKAFLEKVAVEVKEDNFDTMERIKAAESDEALYTIAQEAGLTDSYEVFMEEISKMSGDELSEEDLEAVSGGFVFVLAAAGVVASGIKKMLG